MAEENIVSIVIEKMDLAKPTVIPIVKMMQDDKVGRKITVGLYENGNSWTPPEGVSAQVQYSKPDGTGGLYDSIPGYRDIAWEFEENKLSIFIAPQVTTCPGMVELSVRIIKGEFQFSTFTIKIDVHKTPGINVKSDDFVSVNGLLPSSGWKPNKYLATDENGNVVAGEAPEGGNGAAKYIIDATSVLRIDFAETEAKSVDITEVVNAEELITASNAGNIIRLKFLNADGAVVEIALNGRVDGNSYTLFTGIAENPFYASYSQFELGIRTVDGATKISLEYHLNPMEEKGQAEQFLTLDLSGYHDGIIKRIYADGGESNLDVTFDANGNPIKFSNGVEEFEVVWPAEDA